MQKKKKAELSFMLDSLEAIGNNFETKRKRQSLWEI